ncbi:MAG: hypothetical protein C7B45_00215 [Sulfobacillus acidophilus]|uniref:SHOCT domain-containing protein n=1 Tax=Sulfobacillus acidophilus TaxID=53633 RepID=A0A2T2WPB3_9FIRM|nr:MAG: hypothetical protein C7B45_00215 [Sulfobacillus acidophilus]
MKLAVVILALTLSCPARAMQVRVGSRPTVRVEMLIIIPRQHCWAVFEQAVLTHHHPDRLAVGVLAHAQRLVVDGARRLGQTSTAVKVMTRAQYLGFQYVVTRRGRRQTLSIINPQSVATMLVLVPPTVSLSQSDNPIMSRVGLGRIPGMPNSPIFDEYATHDLQSGQTVPLVFGPPPAVSSGLKHALTGRILEVLTLLVLAITIAVALFTKGDEMVDNDGLSEEWYELAALVTRWTQGEISAEQYRLRRDSIVQRLRSHGEISDG